MGLSIANTHPQYQALSLGSLDGRLVTVTFDSSYATGGESLTAANVGLREIFAVVPLPDANALEGHVVQFDYTAKKLMVFRQIDPANAGGADIALTEVANAVDLSTLVVRCLVIGV